MVGARDFSGQGQAVSAGRGRLDAGHSPRVAPIPATLLIWTPSSRRPGRLESSLGGWPGAASYSHEAVDQLLSAAEVCAQSEYWRREFATGMWRAFQDPGNGSAGDLLGALSGASQSGSLGARACSGCLPCSEFSGPEQGVGSRARSPFSRRTNLFDPGPSWCVLRQGKPPERMCLPSLRRQPPMLGSCQLRTERLDLLVTAALVLRDSTGIVTRQAAQLIGQAVADSPPDAYGVVWSDLLAGGFEST